MAYTPYDYSSAVTSNANLGAANQHGAEWDAKQEFARELQRQRKAMKRQEQEHKDGWWKRMLGNMAGQAISAGAMMAGNVIAPGVGGAVGGALGQSLGSGVSEWIGGSPMAGPAGSQWGAMGVQHMMNSQAPAAAPAPAQQPLLRNYGSGGVRPFSQYLQDQPYSASPLTGLGDWNDPLANWG